MTQRVNRTVLVTGATGKQGGAVARALIERGHRVRALTRNAGAPAAAALAELGADLVTGSFDDRDSLVKAARGVDALFAMTTPFEAGMEAETRQGIALVDAARAASVPHFVLTSVASAHLGTKIPHFESKFAVEQHLRASGLPFTILGPVYFMENAFAPWASSGLQNGTLARGLPPGRKLQQVAVRDIGRFGALVIDRPDEFKGQRIDLASDELSGADEAAVWAKALGRPVSYVTVPIEAIRAQSEDMATMFEWFDRVGYTADVEGLRRRYPEVGWQRFEEWVREQPRGQ